jgi:hypothetical protein
MATNFYMHYFEDDLDIGYSAEEDIDLTHLFAKCVRMTELIRYAPISWENVIANLSDFDVERYGYSVFDWARDTIFD